MPDLDIKDFSATPASNTSVHGVNIDEGALTANMNNSQRGILAVVARGDFGTIPVKADTITESTLDAGITAEGVVLKDNAVQTDSISEKTADTGVTVDGLLIKDGTLPGLDVGAYPPGHANGLFLTKNAGDPNNRLDMAVGSARDDADAANLVLASVLTKRIDAVWAVGDGNGGLDTGTAAANTVYDVYLIGRSDTGVIDWLYTTAISAPTMPASYDQKRLVGGVTTDSSANIQHVWQREGVAGAVDPVSASSLSSVSFLGIPDWVTEVTVSAVDLSTSGTNILIAQIGSGGSLSATGYDGRLDAGANHISNSSFFNLTRTGSGSKSLNLDITLRLKDSANNRWGFRSLVGVSDEASLGLCVGSKALAANMDIFAVSPSGANTLDSGTVSLSYR